MKSKWKYLVPAISWLIITNIASVISATINNSLNPPNIVLIVIDDIGYHDLGIYGNPIHHTPNIDHLAKEGIIFTDFHSNGPVCSPTRAAIMTGQYQQRSNLEYAIGFTKDVGMPLEKVSIAEILKSAGYRCGVFGKWHLGYVGIFGPNEQGFDQSVVSNNTPDYHTHVSRVGKLDWFENQKPDVEPGYLTDLVNNHSIHFIRENKDRSFFLFISHVAAHFPFQGPDDPPHRTLGKIWHDTKYGPLPASQYRRAYKDMIEEVDKSVGDVIQTLEELKLRENTLIFITSDNGAYSWMGSNFPFRGQKGDLYEGGHRIPAIANWPDHIPEGSITDAVTMTMDLAPTFASITGAGFPYKKADIFDGIDLSPVLFQNKHVEERELFWKFPNPYTNSFTYAVRKQDWKYMVKDGKRFLFNLNMDITESNNLIDDYPKRATEFESAYQKWEKSLER